MKAEIKRDIIVTLAREYPQDMSIGELTKATGRARDTVKKYLEGLREEDYVRESRTVGRARMFTVGKKLEDVVDSQGGEVVDDLLQLAE